MEFLVPIVLYGWLPVVILIFRELRGYRAIAFAYVTAWLFLPSAKFPVRGLPDYDKVTATSLGIFMAAVLLEPQRLLSLRPRWYDLPMAVLCLCPLVSAFTNGLGLWHGISQSMDNAWAFGIPYVLGRIYFNSFKAFRALARAIVIGGLIYVPFCLVEIRMSPQFYLWVYGYRPRAFNSFRYGGWRPNVFLEEGLELGMWMTVASLMGIWLWYSGAFKKLWGIPGGVLVTVLLMTTVLCRSTGGLLLLVAGTGTLLCMRLIRSPWPALLLLLIPPVYVGLRATATYDGIHVVQLARHSVNEERARSLQFRLDNETIVVKHTWDALVWGWGGFGRGHVHDEYGKSQVVMDGLWLLTFSYYGLVGLISLYLTLLMCPGIACFRFGRQGWAFEEVAPVLALAVGLILFAIDSLLNAMLNPIYPLALGGLATLCFLPLGELTEGSVLETPGDTRTRLPRRRLWPPPRREYALRP
jgi:hypothetical protein